MAKTVKYEYPARNAALQMPILISAELMDTLGTPEAALAAMAYAAEFLAESIRGGSSFVIFDCSGIDIIATVEEDGDGWYVMVECCNAAAFKRESKTCQLLK
jgi:hypothetical protein